MATFVLQSLGCDVAALNTVHYSRLSFLVSIASVEGLKPPSFLINLRDDGCNAETPKATIQGTVSSKAPKLRQKIFEISTRVSSSLISRISMCYSQAMRQAQRPSRPSASLRAIYE